jgi:hypothetical protein
VQDETPPETIVEVLRSDHDAVRAQLAEPVTAADGHDAANARTELVIAVVRHFVAEEQSLYPTMRERVPDGAAIANADFTTARACESELRRLESRLTDPSELAGIVADVRDRFEAHVAHQEDAVFPALIESLDRVLLLELGANALGDEQLAPTRPRHFVPEGLEANRLAGLVEGFVDRLRDFYTGRGTR